MDKGRKQYPWEPLPLLRKASYPEAGKVFTKSLNFLDKILKPPGYPWSPSLIRNRPWSTGRRVGLAPEAGTTQKQTAHEGDQHTSLFAFHPSSFHFFPPHMHISVPRNVIASRGCLGFRFEPPNGQRQVSCVEQFAIRCNLSRSPRCGRTLTVLIGDKQAQLQSWHRDRRM